MLLLQGNVDAFELHYYFDDDKIHSIEANLRNENEKDLLLLIRSIANTFDIDVEIETYALTQGGLRSRFRLFRRKTKKNAQAVVDYSSQNYKGLGFLLTLLISSVTAPFLLQKHNLDVEKTRLEIQQLKKDLMDPTIDSDSLVKRATDTINNDRKNAIYRSNIYRRLNTYKRVDSVSLTITDSLGNPIGTETKVTRAEFQKFVLPTDTLPPEIDPDASIELISVVLKPGKYAWRGIYKGQSVSFNMQDTVFRKSIQDGDVEFINGFTIRCILEIKKRLDETGNIVTNGYYVKMVLATVINGVPQLTPQGIKHYEVIKLSATQLPLFSSSTDTSKRKGKKK